MRGQIYHPDYGQVVNYELHDLPEDPDGQVAHTIDLMRGYVNADSASPEVRGIALQAASMGGDPIEGVFDHVKRSLRFRNDDEISGKVFHWKPEGMGNVIEVLTRPLDTVSAISQGFIPEEDCDGYSTYAASLLSALGIPWAFATVGADPEEPRRFSHVYVVAYPQTGKYAGQRVAVDCSHGAHLGWECPNRFGKFQEWSGGNEFFGLVLAGVVGYVAYRCLKGRGILPVLPSLSEVF